MLTRRPGWLAGFVFALAFATASPALADDPSTPALGLGAPELTDDSCTGSTGIAHPLANAMPALDSLEIGLGFPGLGLYRRSQLASGSIKFTLAPKKAGLRPGQTYTYFGRIHPFMRGAFKVVR